MNHHDYNDPLGPEEIQALRCMIGNHLYKDCGGTKRRCISCGVEEEDD